MLVLSQVLAVARPEILTVQSQIRGTISGLCIFETATDDRLSETGGGILELILHIH